MGSQVMEVAVWLWSLAIVSVFLGLVFNVLRGYGCYDLSVNVHDPFEGFSMLQPKTNMMRPYSGFKVSFNKTIKVCTT